MDQQDPTFLPAKRKHPLYLLGLILFPRAIVAFKKYLFGDFDESLQNALKIMGDEHIGILYPKNLDCLKTTKQNDFSAQICFKSILLKANSKIPFPCGTVIQSIQLSSIKCNSIYWASLYGRHWMKCIYEHLLWLLKL